MIKLTSDNRMLEYDMQKLYSNIFCFSTTRHGGVSKGNYATMNCNLYCGDEAENVAENRRILCNLLPVKEAKLIIPHQNHGTNIAFIDKEFMEADDFLQKEKLEGVDALVTDLHGACLCISTADCIPVFLYDKTKNVIAAIHAGWRGTVSHIVGMTVEYLFHNFGSSPSDIVASIGPGISVEAFEVGDEVYEAFSEEKFDMENIAIRNQDTKKWHIDLWKANEEELLKSGLDKSNIFISGVCTFNNYDTFFSARRMGIDSGRILSGIMLLND